MYKDFSENISDCVSLPSVPDIYSHMATVYTYAIGVNVDIVNMLVYTSDLTICTLHYTINFIPVCAYKVSYNR